MATAIIKPETITLLDGTAVEIRPLNIKNLRKFMSVMEGFKSLSEDDVMGEKGIDIMVEASTIALNQFISDGVETDYVEENTDLNIINNIMAIAAGVDIFGGDDNPNQTKTESAGKS